MKKLAFLACVALTLASHAVYQKFGVMRLADTVTVTNAAAKLGEHITSPDLDKGFAASLTQSLPAQLLGAQRPGVPTGYVLYIPSDDKGLCVANLSEKLQTVTLYPTSLSRADFLAQYKEEASETNGVISLVSVNEYDSLATNYIAFAADGHWATVSPFAELATAALAETNYLQNAAFNGNFCDFYTKVSDWSAKLVEGLDLKERESLKNVDAVRVGLRVNEKGLDLRGDVHAAKDAAFLKQFDAVLTGAALSFADKNALFAGECAAGGEKTAFPSLFTAIQGVLAKRGIKTGSLTWQETNGVTHVSFDLKKFLAENKGVTNKLDIAQLPQQLVADLNSLTNCAALKVTNAAPTKVAFTIKNAKGACSPAERFAAVLPEVQGKPLNIAFAGSFYGLAKIAIGQCIAANKTDDETAKLVAFMLAALPSAEQGGTAGAYWREGDEVHFHYRLSANELSGLSKLIQISAGFFLSADEETDAEEEEEATENED